MSPDEYWWLHLDYEVYEPIRELWIGLVRQLVAERPQPRLCRGASLGVHGLRLDLRAEA